MPTVELIHVSKTYGRGEKAVDDVSLSIRDGEFLVLVGPSGCGKSTVLRMVAGLEEVTEGQVRIGDRVVNDMAPRDRDIAMVFQNYALYPHMTVYDNMAFGLRRRRLAPEEVDRKVRGAAGTLGLEGYLARRPRVAASIQTDNQAWQAILCHQSQLPGYGPLLDLPCEVLIKIWGEGIFVRVFSLVNSGRSVERDLFEGLG